MLNFAHVDLVVVLVPRSRQNTVASSILWTKLVHSRSKAMQTVNVHAAKTHFSRLVDQAAAGEEIIIAKAGKTIAKLGPLTSRHDRPKRRLGALAGVAGVPPRFCGTSPEQWVG